jgi:hypothetical protein
MRNAPGEESFKLLLPPDLFANEAVYVARRQGSFNYVDRMSTDNLRGSVIGCTSFTFFPYFAFHFRLIFGPRSFTHGSHMGSCLVRTLHLSQHFTYLPLSAAVVR